MAQSTHPLRQCGPALNSEMASPQNRAPHALDAQVDLTLHQLLAVYTELQGALASL